MKGNIAVADAKALRLANELRRRVDKKAGQLSERSPQTERARIAVLAVSRHLQQVIAALETRRSA